jgi:hypothetical protein
MEINPEIKAILKGSKIDVDQGILCLLSIYHNLDADRIIPEELMRKINLTKIIEKDYTSKTITWNVPLFTDQEAGAFSWVSEWMYPFGQIGGSARKGSVAIVTKRMKEWFAKNPEYRKEDVFAARDLYFRTEKPTMQFVKTSYKFIYEGEGAMRVSMLSIWCERVKELKSTDKGVNPLMKGKIV